PRRQPFLVVQGGRALVEEKLVRLGRAGRNDAARAGCTARSDRDGHGRQDGGASHGRGFPLCRSSQSSSAVNPSSSPTFGLKSRSARASHVSAYVCRMSPFWVASMVTFSGRFEMRSIISRT